MIQLIIKELKKKKYTNTTVRRLILKDMINKFNNIEISKDKVNEYIKENKLYLNEYTRGVKKLKAYKRTMKDVKFIEVHKYAPEMNKLHTNKSIFNVPQKTTIKEAVFFLVNTEL